jgi:hypothetical protein
VSTPSDVLGRRSRIEHDIVRARDEQHDAQLRGDSVAANIAEARMNLLLERLPRVNG